MHNTLQVLQHAKKAVKNVNISSRKREPEKWDFANWLTGHIKTKHAGRQVKYDFQGYEPFLDIANEIHKYPQNWFLKGTQIGFSTLMIGWNLYLPYWRGYDCGYGLPDKIIVKPFMKTRFGKEQIEGNKDLAWIYNAHESDMYYDCGAHYLYFLGVNVLSEQLTRPIDQISLDEVTIIKKDAIETIEERMDKSDFAQLNGFARELYPGGPADQGFQEGRQNVRMFKCPACNEWQNIEEVFYNSSLNGERTPGCVIKIDNDWRIVCVKCQKPYSRAQCGHWVAKHPDRDFNSYRLPQLIFDGMNLNRFMQRWHASHGKKSRRAKRHSSGLAIPDAGDLQRINKDTLAKLTRDYKMQRSARWTVGGMDMGNICWPVFSTQDDGSDLLRTLWFQEVDSDHVFEIVSKLIVDLNCIKFVIDALPLTTEARRLAYAFPGIVVLNYYQGKELQEKEGDHLGKEYDYITQDREQCLDGYCDALTPDNPSLVFPKTAFDSDGRETAFEDSTFALHHLRGSQKDEIEDNRLGKKVPQFKKHVPNHYFHSMAYLWTAYCMITQQRNQFVGVA
ncbi:MAG: hypothetical protein ACE5I1_21705, partial [bacterium]